MQTLVKTLQQSLRSYRKVVGEGLMTTLGAFESNLQGQREGSLEINMYRLFCESDSKLDAFASIILLNF